MTPDTRTKHGQPINPSKSPARAADVISLLSGVNYSAIIKVLAAIDLLAMRTEFSAEDLTYFADAPLARPLVGLPEFKERTDAAAALCEQLADGPYDPLTDPILGTTRRFKKRNVKA